MILFWQAITYTIVVFLNSQDPYAYQSPLEKLTPYLDRIYIYIPLELKNKIPKSDLHISKLPETDTIKKYKKKVITSRS